jgi:two-component system, LytTR family, response regulator LytT
MDHFKILIIEDDILIAEYIKEILEEESFNNIRMAHDKEEALHEIANFVPDLILMDINLNGSNTGIELAKNTSASVIYLTGQYDFELMNKAFETNPESYLTKPIKKNDLIVAIQLCIYNLKSNTITLKVGLEMVKINFKEILFIKSDDIYIDVQTKNKKYTLRKSLNAFLLELNNSNFIKVHRSYVVNKSKITSKKTHCLFIDKFEIPISRKTDVNL